MTYCNFVNISIKAGCFIDMQEPKNYKEAKIKLYQRLISKLIYLSCGIRPDISSFVGQLRKHNANPQIGHMKVTKKVVHYLKNIMHLGLIYSDHFKNEKETKALITSFPFGLIEYRDNSYVRDPKNKKFIMGYCYFINILFISWCSKKQRIVSTSITEAEYIALGYTT